MLTDKLSDSWDSAPAWRLGEWVGLRTCVTWTVTTRHQLCEQLASLSQPLRQVMSTVFKMGMTTIVAHCCLFCLLQPAAWPGVVLCVTTSVCGTTVIGRSHRNFRSSHNYPLAASSCVLVIRILFASRPKSWARPCCSPIRPKQSSLLPLVPRTRPDYSAAACSTPSAGLARRCSCSRTLRDSSLASPIRPKQSSLLSLVPRTRPDYSAAACSTPSAGLARRCSCSRTLRNSSLARTERPRHLRCLTRT